MVNHYYVSKKRREKDNYSPDGVMGNRPDHATITYCKKLKEAHPDIPIVIGGIEASLRRLAHYDYISDTLMKSILLDSQADLLLYGMGERSIVEMADSLSAGLAIEDVIYIRGSVWKTTNQSYLPSDAIVLPSYSELLQDKLNYAKSFLIQYENTDPFRSKPLVETYGDIYVVQNLPALPLDQDASR